MTLLGLIPACWTRATSADPDGWTAENPAWGQCAVTALLIQDLLGGDIIRRECYHPDGSIRIRVGGRPWSHYYNWLPYAVVERDCDGDCDGECYGTSIDLTRQQWNDPVAFGDAEKRERDDLLANRNTRIRYLGLRRNLARSLSGYPLEDGTT